MKDESKTKQKLIQELSEAREKIKALETAEIERKAAEEAYKTLMANSLQGLTLVQNRKIVFANLAFVQMSGFTLSELFSFSTDDIKTTIHPDDRNKVWKDLKNRLAGKQAPSKHEFRFIRKDESVCWVETLTSFVEHRKQPAMQITYIDITDRKKAENALIEERNRAEIYLDLLSHDINNYNQAIISSCEILLMKNEISIENRKYIQNTLIQSKAISELISNFRKLSKLDEGPFRREKMDASKILQDSIEYIQIHNPERQLDISSSVKDSEVIVKGTPLLHDVFKNILGYAVKYNNQENVVVDISHEKVEGGKFWKFEFKDTGLVVPEELKGQFFKGLKLGEESVRGSGLGLTLVHEVVKQCGGKVWIEDRVPGDRNQGSNIVVILPNVVKK